MKLTVRIDTEANKEGQQVYKDTEVYEWGVK